MYRVALLAFLLSTTGCVLFGAVPPSRLDVGAGGAVGDHTGTRMRIAYGASLASALRSDIPVDVTAGVIADIPAAKRPKDEAAHWAVGMFFEPSFRVGHWKKDELRMRLWLAPRAELYWGNPNMGRSYLMRTTFELYWPIRGSGAGSSKKSFWLGAVYGTTGVGLYLEAGMRELPGDLPGVLVTGGLVLRIPSAAGIFGVTK